MSVPSRSKSVRLRAVIRWVVVRLFFVEHALEQRHGDGALLGQREAVEAMQQVHQALQVAGEAGQDVVEHLVAQHDAAAAGLLAQGVAGVRLGQRLHGVHRAPAEAGPQVLAHLQVDRRQPAGRRELRAQASARGRRLGQRDRGTGDAVGERVDHAADAARRLDEQRERRVLLRATPLVDAVEQHQRDVVGQLPRRAGRGVEPLRHQAGSNSPRLQLVQQLRLAGAGRPPQVDRRAGPRLLAQLGHHGGVVAGQEAGERRQGMPGEFEDQLFHVR